MIYVILVAVSLIASLIGLQLWAVKRQKPPLRRMEKLGRKFPTADEINHEQAARAWLEGDDAALEQDEQEGTE
jgi:hypothetical protein